MLSMRLPILTASVLVTSLLLGACQNTSTLINPAAYTRNTWEHQPKDCTGKQCPLFNADTLSYPDEAPLNAEMEQRLVQLGQFDQWPTTSNLEALEQQFLSRASKGWENYLQAKEREQHDDFIIIELSSYLYTGGAHGMPGRGFINYQRSQKQVLSLNDLLLPGQEARFWAQAEKAHRFWLRAHDLDSDPEYMQNWPFKQTPHIALLKDKLILKYDVYSIAPYSSGHPELAIDYVQLKGVLKPEYLPAR